MKYAMLQFISLLVISCAYAGIYRHDTDPEKYKSLAAQKQFDCVGNVLGPNSMPEASCVLIGGKYILTAAHIFLKSESARPDTIYLDAAGKRSDTPTVVGTKIIINNEGKRWFADVHDYSFRFGRKTYQPKTLKVFPAYLDTSYSKRCGDMALVELEDSVTDIIPATLNKDYDELGTVITGVGFGVSGRADKPEEVGMYLEKIAGQNMVDTLDGPSYQGKPVYLSCDFDHPTRKDCNKIGSPVPLELEYIVGGGDSGGGAFRQKNGKWELIGIVTGSATDIQQLIKTGYYGQLMHFTRVSVFYKWIEQTMKELS